MDHAARIIAEITGCTADQTQAVITALIERGWSPPDVPLHQPPPGRGGWSFVFVITDRAKVVRWKRASDAPIEILWASRLKATNYSNHRCQPAFCKPSSSWSRS
jgi:hypothetical protein